MTHPVVAPPPPRDRMSGRFFTQCPKCRTHRTVGPDCPAGDAPGPQWRRRVEKQTWRRYVQQEAA